MIIFFLERRGGSARVSLLYSYTQRNRCIVVITRRSGEGFDERVPSVGLRAAFDR